MPRYGRPRQGRRGPSSRTSRRAKQTADLRADQAMDLNDTFKYIEVMGFATGQGGNPQPTTPPDQWVRKFLREYRPPSEKLEMECFKVRAEEDYEMVNATPDQIYKHVRVYDRDPGITHPNQATYKKILLDRLQACSKMHPLDNISTYMRPELLGLNGMDFTTGPGPFWRAQGFTTKQEAWESGAREAAIVKLALLLDGQRPIVGPARAQGRGKLALQSKRLNGTSGIGRMVWETDVTDVAIARLLLTAMNTCLSQTESGIAIGKGPQYRGWDVLRQYFGYDSKPTQHGAGVDVVRMDGNTRNWLVEETVQGLRCLFPDGYAKRWDALFEYLTEMHIGGMLHMPDGFILHVSTGLCSGSPLVANIESLISATMTTHYFCHTLKLSPRQVRYNLRILCLGDDQWITWSTGDLSEVFNLKEFKKFIKSHYQYEINLEKSYYGQGVRAFFFLGRRLTENGFPYRETWESLIRWKYSEVMVECPEESMARTLGIWCDNPTRDVTTILDEYMDWLTFSYEFDWEKVKIKKFKREEAMGGIIPRILGSGPITRLTSDDVTRIYSEVTPENRYLGIQATQAVLSPWFFEPC